MNKIFLQCKFKIPGKGEFICGDSFNSEVVALRGGFWMIRKTWFHETGNMIEPWFADGKIRLLQDGKISVIGKYEYLPVRPVESVTIRKKG